MPTTPQYDAGCLIEPPVSEPNAQKASFAATAAAEPPEEPPGTCCGLRGFFVTPNADVSVVEPIANSSIFVLPMITAPASLRRITASLENCGIKFSNILDEHVVRTPSVHILSLIATGTPANSPFNVPASIFFCASFASFRAASLSNVT